MSGHAITVLGATGYTGALIVRELRRRGLPLVAAGRNPEKLHRLAMEVAGVETAVADVGDQASLDRLAARSRVIINTAGPFIDYGEPVIRAAITHRSHYLDTSGEQPFMKAMLGHDEWARQQRVAVVSAQAFEVAVADCAAALAADGFRDIAAIHVTYVTRFHASQGTQRTVLRMLQSAGYAYLGGEWVEEPPARVARTIELPPPIGRVDTLSVPSAEVITIPRHLEVREVRAFMSVPPAAAVVLPAAVPLMRLLLRSPLARLAAHFVGDGTGGPDEQTRANDDFHIAIEVRGVMQGTAQHRRLLVSGHDPYALTAVIAVHGAALMCGEGFDRCGVLAPAAAFEPRAFLEHLGQFGVRWSI